jgi:hypothetical protein
MTKFTPNLSVDDAVQEFLAILSRAWGSAEPDASRLAELQRDTPEEAEARRFRCAEEVLRLLCSDPRWCTDRRCRRLTMCRRLADLRARQRDRRSPHPRRTPGAAALRHAIWLYMNACRA